MSEKNLTKKQKIEILKQEWLEEAKPYLEKKSDQKDNPHLDGPDSTALSIIQEKYRAKIKEVLEENLK